MKFNYFNKELTKKVLAGTLVGVLSLSGIPKIVYGANNKSNNSISTTAGSNACYDELIGEFDTVGGKFKIYKRDNGSLIAVHKGEKFTDKIEMQQDGTVKTTIIKKNKDGTSTTSTEQFKISNSDSNCIEINTSSIKDSELKECLSAFKNYINGLEYSGVDYVKGTKYYSSAENYTGAKIQLASISNRLDYDLGKNLPCNVSFVLPLVPVAAEEVVAFLGLILTTGVALQNLNNLSAGYAMGNVSGTSIGVAYTTIKMGLEMMASKFNDLANTALNPSSSKSSSDGDISLTLPGSGKNYINLGGELVLAVSLDSLVDGKYMSLADFDNIGKMKDEINKEKKDDSKKEKRIYYQTVFNSADNQMYINLLKPMTIDEAVVILKKTDSDEYPGIEPDPYNIYTFDAVDAIKLLEKAGSKATASYGTSYVNIAENHAFENSHDIYKENKKKNGDINDIKNIFGCGYIMNKKQTKPGFQYWHYHFYKKTLLGYQNRRFPEDEYTRYENGINGKHVFFGIPIYITQKDLNLYSSGTRFCLDDLEMFKGETYINNTWNEVKEYIKTK